jgi:F-type H+-transporting ATPase subunit b
MELVNPGIGVIFWMALSFGLLLLILGKFVWPPVLRALNDREDSIEQALHEADRAREEMKQLVFSNEQLMLEAREERDKLIGEARMTKESLIEDARLKATEEANRIVESARERIHFEKMAAVTELKNQIANLSIDIAEKIVAKELSDPAIQEQVSKDSLKDFNLN